MKHSALEKIKILCPDIYDSINLLINKGYENHISIEGKEKIVFSLIHIESRQSATITYFKQ